MDQPIISKLYGATADIGNGLTMLRVAVDAEMGDAEARGDTRTSQGLKEASVFVDEALALLVKAGSSMEPLVAP